LNRPIESAVASHSLADIPIHQGDFDWQLLKNDVMRAPKCSSAFALITGMGCQTIVIYFTVLIFTWLGFHSLSLRPVLMYSCVCAIASSSFVNGYVMARTLKIFGQTKKWKRNSIAAATVLPFLVMLHVFAIDTLESIEGSHEEFTVFSIFKIVLIWLTLSVPATYIGAYKGMTKTNGDAEDLANRRNTIPRLVPLGQPRFMNILVIAFVSGFIIWLSISVALRFIWMSVWRSEIYSMFGYLFLFSVLLMIIISELSIIWTFLGLKHGDYRW